MTPALVLLARAATNAAEASYTVPRLRLDRRPISRVDRVEMEMFRALALILTQAAGDRVAVRRAVEAQQPRWLNAVDFALALPEWFLRRSERTADLLERWTRRGSLGWELPSPEPARVSYAPEMVLREAA